MQAKLDVDLKEIVIELFDIRIKELKDDGKAVNHHDLKDAVNESIKLSQDALTVFYRFDEYITKSIKNFESYTESIETFLIARKKRLTELEHDPEKQSNLEQHGLRLIEVSSELETGNVLLKIFYIHRTIAVVYWNLYTYLLNGPILNYDRKVYQYEAILKTLNYASNLIRSKTILTHKDLERLKALSPSAERHAQLKVTDSVYTHMNIYKNLLRNWGNQVDETLKSLHRNGKELNKNFTDIYQLLNLKKNIAEFFITDLIVEGFWDDEAAATTQRTRRHIGADHTSACWVLWRRLLVRLEGRLCFRSYSRNQL